ncbi:hypothetical protein NUSPORA_00810 [Nucleospora cyclopteri]
MVKKALHKKINEILRTTNYNNMIDKFSSIELNLKQTTTVKTESLFPKVANFQLPNKFLGTRTNAALEKLFTSSKPLKIDEKKLDEVIEYADNLLLSETTEIEQEKSPNEKKIEKMLNKRYNFS